jgi:hypothetical protein
VWVVFRYSLGCANHSKDGSGGQGQSRDPIEDMPSHEYIAHDTEDSDNDEYRYDETAQIMLSSRRLTFCDL